MTGLPVDRVLSWIKECTKSWERSQYNSCNFIISVQVPSSKRMHIQWWAVCVPHTNIYIRKYCETRAHSLALSEMTQTSSSRALKKIKAPSAKWFSYYSDSTGSVSPHNPLVTLGRLDLFSESTLFADFWWQPNGCSRTKASLVARMYWMYWLILPERMRNF